MTPKEFTFEDLVNTGSAASGPIAAPQRDLLTSLIQFVERAIVLTREITQLLTTAQNDLIPMLTQKVMAKLPQTQLQAPQSNPEAQFNQIIMALEATKTMFGDLKISELIQKLNENKQMVLGVLSKVGGGGLESPK